MKQQKKKRSGIIKADNGSGQYKTLSYPSLLDGQLDGRERIEHGAGAV